MRRTRLFQAIVVLGGSLGASTAVTLTAVGALPQAACSDNFWPHVDIGWYDAGWWAHVDICACVPDLAEHPPDLSRDFSTGDGNEGHD